MNCPKCKNVILKPTRLEEGLSALGCHQCHGALVSLLYYRDWAERKASLHDVSDTDLSKELDFQDSTSVLSCPKCSRIMQKFRISGCSSNRLDLCTFCDEAWLDGGEWELLKALELSMEMPTVFTEQWQKKVRGKVSENARKERFSRILSSEDLEKADSIRSWLKKHPQRNEIIFYVNHE